MGAGPGNEMPDDPALSGLLSEEAKLRKLTSPPASPAMQIGLDMHMLDALLP
jgi:hypothetical protein